MSTFGSAGSTDDGIGTLDDVDEGPVEIEEERVDPRLMRWSLPCILQTLTHWPLPACGPLAISC